MAVMWEQHPIGLRDYPAELARAPIVDADIEKFRLKQEADALVARLDRESQLQYQAELAADPIYQKAAIADMEAEFAIPTTTTTYYAGSLDVSDVELTNVPRVIPPAAAKTYRTGTVDTSQVKITPRLQAIAETLAWDDDVVAPLKHDIHGPLLAEQGWTRDKAIQDPDAFLAAAAAVREATFEMPEWVTKRATVKHTPKHAGDPSFDMVDALGRVTEKTMEKTAQAARAVADVDRQKLVAGSAAALMGLTTITPQSAEPVKPVTAQSITEAGHALAGKHASKDAQEQAAEEFRSLAHELESLDTMHHARPSLLDQLVPEVSAYYTKHADKLHPGSKELHHASDALVDAIAKSPHALTREQAHALEKGLGHAYPRMTREFYHALVELSPDAPHRALHSLAALLTVEAESSISHHVKHHDAHHAHAQQLGHPKLTPHNVKKILPHASEHAIHNYTPLIMHALKERGIADPQMVAYAFATINAETSRFLPIPEYGTGAEYEGNVMLGNTHAGDGERFKGEGFIQLTGRRNFTHMDEALHLHGELLRHPEKALEPKLAAEIFAQFLYERKQHIHDALNAGDLAAARAVVNGGTNGLDRFTEAYKAAIAVVDNGHDNGEQGGAGDQSGPTSDATGESASASSLDAHGQEVCDQLGIPYLGVQDGYKEGVKTPVALCEIGGQPVNVEIAKNVLDMFAAAKTDGINFTITLGFRTYDKQVELRQENDCPDVYTSPAEACKVPTAIPGFSEHETGNAMDLGVDGVPLTNADSAAHDWLVANAAQYGFYSNTGENWHWSVDGH